VDESNQIAERQWAYELWVHLSDHVNQKYEHDEPDDCEHCREAEVDCDDCRKLLVAWEASLSADSDDYLTLPESTHQKQRKALEFIAEQVHPRDKVSSCGGLPYCLGCTARVALGVSNG
jgi:hypothetical protein